MVDEKYQMQDDESTDDYILRICELGKKNRLTWQEIADIINEETDLSFSESKYRKDYRNYCKGVEVGLKSAENEVLDEVGEEIESNPAISKLLEAKINMQKERFKLSDERTQTNAYIRRLAREETIKEIGLQAAREMNSKKLLEPQVVSENKGDNVAILEISDWHLGLDFENYWNKYNIDETKRRVALLRDKTIEKCLANNVKELYVVNLADLICGRIHLVLRLQSRIDVITQTMLVAELVGEMLTSFSEYFEVHYYDCLDNHSRLEPNKKEAMDLESLARIIPWYLSERVGKFVNIHQNNFGDDIITFEIKGYKILGVHGDKDKPNAVVKNLTCMTHEHYDLVLTAHLHHFSADEQNETLVVSNGSLMGTDSYAANLRLSSKASQNLIIVTDNSVAEAIYRIVLN